MVPSLNITLGELLHVVGQQQPQTGWSVLYMNTYVAGLRFSPTVKLTPVILDAETKNTTSPVQAP